MDPHSGAEQLLSSLLSATTPPLISSSLSSTISFLRLHPPDQCRPFFSIAFPALLSRLFAFGPTPAWIDLPDPHLVSLLLSPSGPLLSTILAVDRHSLLKYSFPGERLPAWIRHALHHHHLHPLSPLLRSRALHDPPQLQLNVFDYYLFWFAYYPVCKAASSPSNPSPAPAAKQSRFTLESWTSTWTGGPRRGRRKAERGLYPRLLYAYLRAFVPLYGTGLNPWSSLLNYDLGGGDAVFARAELVVNVFVQFWMVDNDFSPVSVRLCESLGLEFPMRNVSREAPPAPGLGEVLEVLVKYVNSGLIGPAEEGGRVEFCGSPGWGGLGTGDMGEMTRSGVQSENLARSWNSAMQRPLYRYILRSFLFCPMGTSTKNVSQVFSLWMSYLEPWKIDLEEFAGLELSGEQNVDGSCKNEPRSFKKGKEKCASEFSFSPPWSCYVASNYLFYSSLVVHFLGFAHKFLHIDAEVIVQMTLKVMLTLTSSKRLLDLLKEIDAACHSKSAGTSSAVFTSANKYVPSIREQFQDWEDGLCKSEADGSFLLENWNRDLKLFSESEDGVHYLLQLLILRAEPELRAMSSDNEAENFQNLESLRSQMSVLFGGPLRRSQSPVVPRASTQVNGREDVFMPNRPGVGKHKWADINYQGDWMRRPISDGEVAWLARHLVQLSDWLNDLLGLNTDGGNDHAGPTYLEVPSTELETVWGSKEVFWMLLNIIGSCFKMLAQAVLTFMRRHGWRINLRVLASKKLVMALLLYTLISVIRQAL